MSDPGPSVILDKLNPRTITSIEIGTLLALFVHGTLLPQYLTYYKQYPNDSALLKCVVAATGLACLGHITSIIWALYEISVIGPMKDPSKPFAMPLMIPIGLIFTAVLQFLVQLTYVYRMHKFSKNIMVPIFASLGVLYNIIAAPVFAAKFPLTSFQDQLAYEHKRFWLINSQFINTAVNDVVITISMCYYLKKGRQDGLRRTKRVIERLVLWTIQSSAPTCFLGIAVVTTFMLDLSNNVWIGLSIFATPIYPAALLALLNGRESLSTPNTSSLAQAQAQIHFTNLNETTSNSYTRNHVTMKSVALPLMRPSSTSPASAV
ncbi:hypothetical protein BDN72DRAFT_218808 [Pluteus cervinus]|uniref:Uncharacterized protein n=1 Tax=Pluteus cervinus TaxID=181527 RepID=A0ACD3AJK7_9AGAR|nr:hypothetical protein BDN72DRAFT_218808 [Pluteus cervinus]